MLEKDSKTLYNLAEIYLGLLDLIEDSKEERSEDTKVRIMGNTGGLRKTLFFGKCCS